MRTKFDFVFWVFFFFFFFFFSENNNIVLGMMITVDVFLAFLWGSTLFAEINW